MNNEILINQCSELLAKQVLTIAFAESATAGKLAFDFSLTPYSGLILKGGLVSYNASVKEEILGIPKELIEQYTPESAEVTKEMAIRLKKLMSADVTVAITGLTTAGGSEQPGKPVGTMFYCICFKGQLFERKKIFKGSPIEIMDLTIEQITKTLIHALAFENDK